MSIENIEAPLPGKVLKVVSKVGAKIEEAMIFSALSP
jgi:hypothetical protein